AVRERVQQREQVVAPRRRDDDGVGDGVVDGVAHGAHPFRRTANGPMASRSTGAEPKHSNASRGSSTIGRPAVLRLVFTTVGSPVLRSNAVSMSASSGSS